MKARTSRTCAVLVSFACTLVHAQDPPTVSAEKILEMYLQAAGGQQAIERINSRELHGTIHGGQSVMESLMGRKKAIPGLSARRVTAYWQKPDKAVETITTLTGIVESIGFDGKNAWRYVPKGRFRNPSRDEQDNLESMVNPLRFVFLKTLYSRVQLEAPESLDSKKMLVISATTEEGITKFYFDPKTHLLVDVAQISMGPSSSFRRDVRFKEYRRVDGVSFPFRISFTVPDTPTVEIRFSKALQNVSIDPKQFTRP